MTPEQSNSGKFNFPVWQFLNQPLFSSHQKLILNPRRFWHVYRIHLLERCWMEDFESEGNHRNF